MNHTDSLGVKQLFTPLRFRCQQVFFHFRENFFRGPVGATRWREGDLCLIFKPASRTFLPSGKISFPVALSDMTSSLARTALCAFSTPPSSIFPQKNLWICSLLTDYSINMPKRHRKMFAFFFKQHAAPPKKSRYRQCRNGALAMHPPAFPAPPIQRHKTAGGASLAATSSSHRWRRTPNDSTLPRLPPATSGPLVRPYPAALFGHKKAGKGLPFPACHG